MTATLEADLVDDIDFDIDIDIVPTPVEGSAPELWSKILCTAGCTSSGGGSMCSWCC